MRGIPAWELCMKHARNLPTVAQEDVEAALRRVDPGFPKLIGELARDLGLEGDDRDLRRDGCILEFASIQVADDLADAECNYLRAPERTGPGLHWLLQHLSYVCLLKSRAARSEIERAAIDFSTVGAAQQIEVRTDEWNLERARAAAAGLNGKQYSAYLRILGSGSPRLDELVSSGDDFGFALHVATDRATADRRWTSLGEADRAHLAEAACQAARRASKAGLPAFREPLAWLESVLAAG